MKKLRLLCFLAISITFLLSCEETIIFDSHTENYKEDAIQTCITVDCPDVDLNILVLDEPSSLAPKVNQWVTDLTLQFLTEEDNQKNISFIDAIDIYINSSQISYPETSSLSDAHELTIDTGITYSDNTLLSIIFYGYEFSGGAHGFDTEVYGNFNPQTGEEYKNKELVGNGFYAFAKAQLTRLYPDYNFSDNSDNYQEIGFAEDGVMIIYNDSDAASINSDKKSITIPWETSREYLNF